MSWFASILLVELPRETNQKIAIYQSIGLSYKGIWGYAPLIISLANTREVLYLVNRLGNVVSHEGCMPWIDRAIELVLAEALPEEAWKPLERLPRYEIATEPRAKAPRIKEAIVRFKGYLNKKLVGESVAEFNYQPNKCGREYRLVVVRKNISVQKGEAVLFEDIKYNQILLLYH